MEDKYEEENGASVAHIFGLAALLLRTRQFNRFLKCEIES